MDCIIMMHGLPLAGKSTAAKNIKNYLNSKGIKSKVIKSVVTRYKEDIVNFTEKSIDENIPETRQEKDESYREMCNLARNCLTQGIIPILDATFHKKHRRELVYNLAKEENISTIVVWLEYNSIQEIRKMLDYRRNNPSKDGVLHTEGQYNIMKKQAEPITSDEQIKLIKYNRENNTITFNNCNEKEDIISMICDALKCS